MKSLVEFMESLACLPFLCYVPKTPWLDTMRIYLLLTHLISYISYKQNVCHWNIRSMWHNAFSVYESIQLLTELLGNSMTYEPNSAITCHKVPILQAASV